MRVCGSSVRELFMQYSVSLFFSSVASVCHLVCFPWPTARIIGGGGRCLRQEVVRTDAALHSLVIDEAAHLLRHSSVFNIAFSFEPLAGCEQTEFESSSYPTRLLGSHFKIGISKETGVHNVIWDPDYLSPKNRGNIDTLNC